MQKYGIFSPRLGKRTNYPVQLLDDAVTPLSENVRTVDGEIHRAKGRVEVLTTPAWDATTDFVTGKAATHGGATYVSTATPNVNNEPPHANWTAVTVPDSTSPILHYHRLVLRSGAGYLFAFTKDAIYEWDETNSYWANRVGETDAAEAIVIDNATTEWSTCTYNDQVIATNNKQAILVGSNGTDFIYLGDNASIAVHGLDLDGDGNGTKVVAKFVLTYENYLFCGNLSEAGTAARNRLRYCGIGDETDWDDTGAAAGYNDIPNQTGLVGAAVSGDRMFVFGETNYGELWLTANADLRFEYAEISPEYGCKAAGSIVTRADGTMLFLASDMRIRVARTGQDVSEVIGDVLDQIPLASIATVRATRIEEYDEIWWAIPYGINVTANNRVLTMTARGAWNELLISVPCFGRYSTQTSYTIGTLPYATLTEWREYWATIGDMQGGSGFLYDITADTAGATWRLHAATSDKGETFTGRFSLETDLSEKVALNMFKRLLRVRVYVMRDGGTTVDLAVARDREMYWRHQGSEAIPTASAADNEEMVILDYPVNLRARHFGFRIGAADGDFRCIGAEFEFNPDGAR